MFRRMAPRPLYDVMAGLSLLLVLTGGTALAIDGSLPGQNTVGSADIIDGEVTPADIKADSIGGGKIADRQVKNADLGLGASSSNTIADGGVASIDVKDETLTPDDLGPGAVDREEIEFDAVSGAEIESGTVQDSDLESAIVRPKAMAISDGNCVTDDNCPLEFSRGITSVERQGPGLYCIETGGYEGTMIGETISSLSSELLHFAAPDVCPNGYSVRTTRRRLPGRSVWRTASNSGWPCTDGSVEQRLGCRPSEVTRRACAWGKGADNVWSLRGTGGSAAAKRTACCSARENLGSDS